MTSLLRFLFGFVLGAVAGAVLAMLFAPQSGVDTQQAVQERIQLIRAEARRAADQKRQELMTQFETLKQATSES